MIIPRPGPGNGDGLSIADIQPAAAAAGQRLTITGSNFGQQQGTVQCWLSTTPGTRVPAQIVSWAEGTDNDVVVVLAPDLGATGGAALLSVLPAGARMIPPRAPSAQWTAIPQVPLAITAITPPHGVSPMWVQVTGTGFGAGRGQRPGGAYSITVNGLPATVSGWTERAFTVQVTAAPGTATILIQTSWGTSQSTRFTVVRSPNLDPTTPLDPATAVPDAIVTIRGSGFSTSGAVVVGSRDGLVQAEPETVSWADDAVAVRVPGVARLEPRSVDQISLTANGITVRAPFAVVPRASITSFTRIEPHTRTDDLEQGLRLGLQAQTYDAAWLLSRQWQLGEFAGEDAGSPVRATLDLEQAKLARWRPAGGIPADLPAVPLELLATREAATAGAADWSGRRAVESGMQFLRLLTRVTDATRRARYRQQYLGRYPLTPLADDSAAARFIRLAAGRVPDGKKLYIALRQALPPGRGGTGRLPPQPLIDPRDSATVLALIAAWFDWCSGLVETATPGTDAWVSERLEYSFAASAETVEGEIVLAAREYDGEPLDWYDFVVDSRTSLRSPTGARPSPTTVTTTAIPAPVSYPGMPAERFWQFEDASVDLGGVDAAPIDLARLLLLEFVTVYGNDWHVVPVGPIAAGSLVRLRSLTVTTSFGESVAVHPFSTNAAVARAWRMFELEPLAVPGGPTPATADLLFVPPSLASRLESTPLEEVDFVRDEVAALVWGIERTVPDVTERPFDRFSAYQARREQQRQGPSSPPIAPLAPLSYRLHTDVPDFWIPFVPTNKDGTRRLVQTPMAGVNALGRTMGSPALELYDEEVPRSGTRLTRVYRYARWIDGSTHVWLARRRSVGGTGSSGLRFDSVDPAP